MLIAGVLLATAMDGGCWLLTNERLVKRRSSFGVRSWHAADSWRSEQAPPAVKGCFRL